MIVRSATVYYGRGNRDTLFAEGDSEQETEDKLLQQVTEHSQYLGAALSHLFLFAFAIAGGLGMLLTSQYGMDTDLSFVPVIGMLIVLVRSSLILPTIQRAAAWRWEMKYHLEQTSHLQEQAWARN